MKLLALPLILSLALVGCGSDPRAKDPNCTKYKNYKGETHYFCLTPSDTTPADIERLRQASVDAAFDEKWSRINQDIREERCAAGNIDPQYC